MNQKVKALVDEALRMLREGMFNGTDYMTFREICEKIGIDASGSIHKIVSRLEYLEWSHSKGLVTEALRMIRKGGSESDHAKLKVILRELGVSENLSEFSLIHELMELDNQLNEAAKKLR